MALSRIVRAMRSQIHSLALTAVVVAACGGGGASTTPGPTSAANPTPPASQAAASTSSGGGTGSVDCSAFSDAGAQLVIGVQVLAQMRTPDAVAAVKNKTFANFDPDAFIAAMQTLHALDGSASPLGDPKAPIDAYIQAGQAAKELLAKSSVTQADVDAYLTTVGTIADFLGKQMAISGAMSAAGC